MPKVMEGLKHYLYDNLGLIESHWDISNSCLAVGVCPRSLFPLLIHQEIAWVGRGPVCVDAASCTQWACEW